PATPAIYTLSLHDALPISENSIERRRRATALQMTKHTGAGFFPGARRNLMRHDVADSAQAKLAFFRFAFNLLSILWARAFCDNDQRTQIPGDITRANGVGHSVEIEWNFRDQDNISPTCDTTMQCDPTGVSPHHFHHNGALMARSRGMETIERVHHRRHCGIETEGHGRGFKIVVDRLRHADAIDSSLLQLQGGRHGAIAANDDECFDACFI